MRKSLSFHSSVRYFKYIVLVLLFYPLTVLGAQGHITVKGQSITIKEAIMLIEKNSNYVFFYNAADLKNIRLKNINCSGPIDKVLNEVFANTGITYLIQGNDVVLKVSKTESAQQAKKTEIVGVVTDARTGEAVIGASVAIVGTTTGVMRFLESKNPTRLHRDDLYAEQQPHRINVRQMNWKDSLKGLSIPPDG